MHKNRKSLFRATALVLIVLMLCPLYISAMEPRASYYLDSYQAYPYSAGLGKIQIYFNVTGVMDLDDIGAIRLSIYESTDQINWTLKATHTNGTTPDMLGHNTCYYSSHVDYQGVIGRYYKAYICIWGGKDGDGDTRYFWTSATKATLLAQ
jgi:hypothetical protein